MKQGMTCLWRNFGKRLKHKTAAMHGRMRNLEAGLVDNAIVIKQDIDIDLARALLAEALPTHEPFER